MTDELSCSVTSRVTHITLTLSSNTQARDHREPQPQSLSHALKRAFVVALIVRAKARTYLRNNGNNDNGKKQMPYGDDNKKSNNKQGNSNCSARRFLDRF